MAQCLTTDDVRSDFQVDPHSQKFIRTLSTAAAVHLALLPAHLATALTVDTPTSPVSQCSTVSLSWSGGTPPYYPEVTAPDPAFQLEMLDPDGTRATSGTWLVSVAAGTEVVFEVFDALGSSNVSEVVTVQAGGDAGCLGQISFAPAGDNVYTSRTTVAGMSTAVGVTTSTSTTATSQAATTTTIPSA